MGGLFFVFCVGGRCWWVDWNGLFGRCWWMGCIGLFGRGCGVVVGDRGFESSCRDFEWGFVGVGGSGCVWCVGD